MRTHRNQSFDHPPAVLWDVLEQVDSYPTWWPGLRSFQARSLDAGERWTCAVQPPLPYRIRFTVDLVAVERPSLVHARIAGDVEGEARIDLAPSETGTALVLTAELRAGSRWLRGIDRWAHPIARFGHDRVIDGALTAFADAARGDQERRTFSMGRPLASSSTSLSR